MNKKQSVTARNIYAIRNHYGYNQTDFGERVGVSQVTVSNWETSGHDMSRESIEKVISAFPVSYDDIKSDENGFANKVNKADDECGYIEIPLLARIAAGTPIEMEDYSDSFSIPAKLHERYPDAFLLRVDGESMNRVLPNGCYALVDPCHEVLHEGKPYAICVNGYDATIKRVRRLNNGFELVPDSTDPTYAPTVYNFNDPQTDPVIIIGEVVYYVLPYDWGF